MSWSGVVCLVRPMNGQGRSHTREQRDCGNQKSTLTKGITKIFLFLIAIHHGRGICVLGKVSRLVELQCTLVYGYLLSKLTSIYTQSRPYHCRTQSDEITIGNASPQ